jgi:hypothetical protein
VTYLNDCYFFHGCSLAPFSNTSDQFETTTVEIRRMMEDVSPKSIGLSIPITNGTFRDKQMVRELGQSYMDTLIL